MLHLTIFVSPSRATLKPECDEIAALLNSPDVDVRVYEQPVTYQPDSDFWLVLADDLSWHEEALRAQPDARIDRARFVVLRPPHDRATDLAETHRVAAVVDYDGAAVWREASRSGLTVRTDIASELPGELGRIVGSTHYGSWCSDPREPLGSQLVTYLRAFLQRAPRDLTLIRAEDAKQRGFAAVTIRGDVGAAGLTARPFPGPEILVAVSGPPGGVISIIVSNATSPSNDLAEVIRSSLGAWLGGAFEFAGEDHAQIVGGDRSGLIFYTGAGFQRVGRFGCVVRTPGGTVVVSVGVSARSAKPITAADILANRAIATALLTFEIE